MSANPAAGRPAVNPNETKAQKLQRLAGGRTTRLLDSIDKWANLGGTINEYMKDNPNANKQDIINQLLNTVQDKFREAALRIQTGERSKTEFQLNV